jgi:type 1 glutamine amidotransferase
MKHSIFLLAALALPLSAAPDPLDFQPLFDGESLKHWDGDPRFWSVQDGVITGQTTAETPTKGNTFLIWKGGELDDFELKVDFKIESGNSGIQIRSFPLEGAADQWRIGGYQADFDFSQNFAGLIYGERYRGILAKRGQKAEIGENGKPVVTGATGDPAELVKAIKTGDWNTFHIVAKGNHIKQSINGVLMAELTDNDDEARRTGLLALQLHQGPPMKVQFRNIMLKRLKMEDKKKVVFLAGRPSHGHGAHEHRAGCMLLARLLNENIGDKIHAVTYHYGWPADPTALQNADSIIIFCDGGGRHLAKPHLHELEPYMQDGVGLGCIHYGVEIPKGGEGGDHFLRWIGGFFETHWSVNPHWTAEFTTFPDHEVANGLEPFAVRDEWYYHMRFNDDGTSKVTSVLKALPPKETLSRKDGAHSGNPHVRAAVLERKEEQTVCWIIERPDGGRGFGFTGAHFHHNWANDSFRKTVLNCVTWISHVEVPAKGVHSNTPTEEELLENQDFPPKKKP